MIDIQLQAVATLTAQVTPTSALSLSMRQWNGVVPAHQHQIGDVIGLRTELDVIEACLGQVGAPVWGSITGNISAQTDLQAALAAAGPVKSVNSKTGNVVLVSSDLSDFASAADARIAAAVGVTVQALAATLTALAGTSWAANAMPIGTGAGTVAQTAFAANTFPARASTGNLVAKPITDFSLGLLADADAAAWRGDLGLGTLATLSAAPAGTLTGATLAAGVTGSSLTGTGTLTSGATGAGFTLDFGASTLSGIIGSAHGGTGNGFTKFTGPTTAERTFTLPNADATLLYSGGALGTPSSGVATNLTGTASGLTAGNVTTNANLTGPITSVGNATSVASQTGTGTTFVMNTAPTIAGGSITGLTGLAVRSTGAAFDLTLASSEVLTAGRTLSFSLGDAARTLTIGASASVSGSNTGDQTITLTSDVTGSGTGSFATTIAAGAVTYAKMQNVSATSRILGRITAGAGSPEELTAANVKTILALAASDVGLGSVTNDAQTKAAIVPNTAPSAAQLLVGNAGGTAYAPVSLSGPVSITSAGVTSVGTLNQNTTGSAATLTTAHSIYGNNFDGSAALGQIIASTYGGTGNGFTKFSGPTTSEKTFTLPDASSTLLYSGGALGTPSSGTLTNATGLPPAGVVGTAAILGANTFTDLQTYTIGSANTGVFASTGYSLTGSSAVSMVSLAGTLNTSGAPDVFKIAITDTARGAATKLFNIYGGASASTSEFSIDRSGNIFSAGSIQLGTSSTGYTLQSGGSLSLRVLNAAASAWAKLSVANLGVDNTGLVVWGTFGGESSLDTGFARAAANVPEVNSGTKGAYTGTALMLGAQTVAQLPAAATALKGARATVSDATATTFLSIVAGSGSNIVPVFCNGTNWLIG